MRTNDEKSGYLFFRLISSGVFILLLLLCAGCSNGGNTAASQTPWETLVQENRLWSGKTGCWEGYNQGGDPGEYYEYPGYGLRIDYAHPEYYATINPDGSLTKPGYQDAKHQGQASIDYTELLQMCQNIHDKGVSICFAMFIHNFETVGSGALQEFFQNWSKDLKAMGIGSIIFIPAWEVQGQWPAWPEGATRDCFISPSAFNSQMVIIKAARDNARAAFPDGAEILLGGVLNAWLDIGYPNSDGNSYSGRQYIAGLQQADWVGVDYYPGKAGTYGGPEDAFQDASALYGAVGTGSSFAIFEYSPQTSDGSNWSNGDKVDFIKTTYELLQANPFIKQVDWWFIGRGSDNVRISCDQ